MRHKVPTGVSGLFLPPRPGRQARNHYIQCVADGERALSPLTSAVWSGPLSSSGAADEVSVEYKFWKGWGEEASFISEFPSPWGCGRRLGEMRISRKGQGEGELFPNQL